MVWAEKIQPTTLKTVRCRPCNECHLFLFEMLKFFLTNKRMCRICNGKDQKHLTEGSLKKKSSRAYINMWWSDHIQQIAAVGGGNAAKDPTHLKGLSGKMCPGAKRTVEALGDSKTESNYSSFSWAVGLQIMNADKSWKEKTATHWTGVSL